MSDQTAPSDQPAAPPPEDVDASAGAGVGAPPPPAPPDDTVVGTTPPPPAAPKKSRTGLIVAVIAGLVVLALVAVLVVVFVFARGDDKHSITIPATAGGMKTDKTKAEQLKPQLDAAEQQFKRQFKDVTYVKSGVYDQDDTKRGPKGALVLLGAKVKASEKNAETFVATFKKQATSNSFKVTDVKPGDGGGKVVCAEQSSGQKVAICAWATKDSGGELVPTVPGYDSKQLSKILLDLRADVEKTD